MIDDKTNQLTVRVLRRRSSKNRLLCDAFLFNGCNSAPLAVAGTVSDSEQLTGTEYYQMFLRERDEHQLCLPAPASTAAFELSPGTFELLPHHNGYTIDRHPFFYQDDNRSFVVIPSQVQPDVSMWPNAAQIDPGCILDYRENYYSQFRSMGSIQMPRVLSAAASNSAVARRLGETPGRGESFTTAARTAVPEYGDSCLDYSSTAGTLVPTFHAANRYQFQTFYHPHVCTFVRELNHKGVDGLLQRQMQIEPLSFVAHQQSNFVTTYEPVDPPVIGPYPGEDVDFEDGAYSLYNWELFFHAPLMIADRLSKNQRFEEAQKWFHYIFDPTDHSTDFAPQRYWRTKKFYETTRGQYQKQHIEYILRLLARGNDPAGRALLSPEELNDLEKLQNEVARWRKDPFKPHLIARLRTVAYQKTVVMKYLDNLVAWADQLFRRETIESLNEATQLYVLAGEILGRHPQAVPARAKPRIQTYNSLEDSLDSFSNAQVQIEEFVPPSTGSGLASASEEPPLSLPMLYFCVPNNDKLLSYWDLLADRLFKIRHSMTIEGVVRQLPLFEPPIEPGLLVRAKAAGVDISSILNDVNVALPHYRFSVLAQRTVELCSELKSLGSALLAALEKRDAEELALLRAAHETALLKLVEEVRRQQHDEAVQNLAAFRQSRQVAVGRYLHYQRLLGIGNPEVPGEGDPIPERSPSPHAATREDGVMMIQHEKEEMEKLEKANDWQGRASWSEISAVAMLQLPIAKLAYWGIGVELDTGRASSASASYCRDRSADEGYQGSRAARLAQYVLRAHDWMLQSNVAAGEIMQIDKQVVAAEIRKAIAAQELQNHRKQSENAQAVEDCMRDKYTSQELYAWTVGQVSAMYFQAYQLAYEMAKRAERAYRYELAVPDSSFIQFGYWDNLKRGLLAGEKLYNDLKRMELAYLDLNKREYEITKHISLSQLDPLALVQLRQTGECFVCVPEAWFDLDYPGHIMRRIRSIGVTIPCVTGPYTGVSCTLTLQRSSIRHASSANGQYGRTENDPRFTDSLDAVQSIVTSTGQNDTGLFETGLRDERYLPFEGAGVISDWRIELPREFRQFDYDTISDVILHMRYTARDGGEALRCQAATGLHAAINAVGSIGPARLFSLRREFPTAWHRFLNPPSDSTGDQSLAIDLSKDRFPFLFQKKTISINSIEVFVKVKPELAETYNESTLNLYLESGAGEPATTLNLVGWNGLLHATKSPAGALGTWTLSASLGDGQRLEPNAIDDILLVCLYQLS